MSPYPAQDFDAAVEEIESNLDLRRLVFVVVHLLVPGLVVAGADCLAGTAYPPYLAWLPRHVLLLLGAVLALAGASFTTVLARCHYGMVVNGNKLTKVRTGALPQHPLNWLGVTTNLVAATAVSAGAGAWLALASLGMPVLGAAAAAALVLLLLAALALAHRRANRLSRRLDEHWQHVDVPAASAERHLQKSLAATANDVSIVVSMEAALFVGLFTAMANLGAIAEDVPLGVPPDAVRRLGVPVLSGWLVVFLLLAQRMVLRLRLALADHSAALARLRQEPDDAYRFRWMERTFLLYLLGTVLLAAAVALLAASLAPGRYALAVAAAVVLLSLLRYPTCLARHRRRRAAREP